jgi:general stress protein YciG
MSDTDTGVKGKGRGFASMDPEKLKLVASKGGKSVPPAKRSFSQNRELAAAAGSKGGKRVPSERRSFALSKDLASAAGKKGRQKRSEKKTPPA